MNGDEFEKLVDYTAEGGGEETYPKRSTKARQSRWLRILVLIVMVSSVPMVGILLSIKRSNGNYSNSTHHYYTESGENSTTSEAEESESVTSLNGVNDAPHHNTTILHNYSEVLSVLNCANLSFQEKLNLFLPIEPNLSERTIKLYSRSAQQRLLQMLNSSDSTSKNNLTIVANGASTVARGGHVAPSDLFFAKFAKLLEQRFFANTSRSFTLFNAGHGGRMSYQTTLLAESLLPPQADILIWEFSQTDQVSKRLVQMGFPEEDGVVQAGVVEERNLLLLWLEKVNDFYAPDPPIIILVYFWDSPMLLDDNREYGNVLSQVFDHHDGLGGKLSYDNVLGHVHMADYVDMFEWTRLQLWDHILAYHDDHHPGPVAHHLTALLMERLVVDQQLDDENDENHNNTLQPVETPQHVESLEYQWVCGNQSQGLEQLYEHVISKHRLSKASFTADLPTAISAAATITTDSYNTTNEEKQLHPMFLPVSGNNSDGDGTPQELLNWTLWQFGKEDPARLDRLRALQIPKCDGEGRLWFDIHRIHTPLHAISFLVKPITTESIPNEVISSWPGHGRSRELFYSFDGGEFVLAATVRTLRVFVNDVEDVTSRMISGVNATCVYREGMFQRWILLDPPIAADNISMCRGNEDTNVGGGGGFAVDVQHIACQTLVIF